MARYALVVFTAFNRQDKTDYCLIAACRRHQNAWAKAGATHSVFTEALLAGLSPENARDNRVVTTTGLLSYLETTLTQARQEVCHLGSTRRGWQVTIPGSIP